MSTLIVPMFVCHERYLHSEGTLLLCLGPEHPSSPFLQTASNYTFWDNMFILHVMIHCHRSHLQQRVPVQTLQVFFQSASQLTSLNNQLISHLLVTTYSLWNPSGLHPSLQSVFYLGTQAAPWYINFEIYQARENGETKAWKRKRENALGQEVYLLQDLSSWADEKRAGNWYFLSANVYLCI